MGIKTIINSESRERYKSQDKLLDVVKKYRELEKINALLDFQT